MMRGELASWMCGARWDLPSIPQIYVDVIGVADPGSKKGTSRIFRKDRERGIEALRESVRFSCFWTAPATTAISAGEGT